ncbi:MAG: transketolase C-terminal domain-containing protein, partial [Bacteroidota bacterium]
APMDEVELRNMMFTAQEKPMGPFSIRYPRGNGVITKWRQPFTSLTPGKGRVIQEGNDMAILSIGSIGNQVKEVTRILNEENIDVAHYDMRWVKPLDEAMLDEIFRKFNKIITIEDGVIAGGFGSAIIEYMTENGYQAQVIRLGVPDRFIDHGTPEQLYKECGFDVASICNKARSMVKPRVYSNVG